MSCQCLLIAGPCDHKKMKETEKERNLIPDTLVVYHDSLSSLSR